MHTAPRREPSPRCLHALSKGHKALPLSETRPRMTISRCPQPGTQRSLAAASARVWVLPGAVVSSRAQVPSKRLRAELRPGAVERGCPPGAGLSPEAIPVAQGWRGRGSETVCTMAACALPGHGGASL